MKASELAGLQLIARDACGEEIFVSDPASPAPPRSILIADDNESVRRVLVEFVRLAVESEVLEAANGIEALRIVKHQRPDVVLLDLTMPGLGAYETIRQMRMLDPHIRIIVITGDGSEETEREVEYLGVELLVKPVHLRALDVLFGRAQ
jgi:CheY-like chemotaxis protein